VGREVELKLAVLPSAIDEIVRLPWLSEISNGAEMRKVRHGVF
jgi:hypothetical protein